MSYKFLGEAVAQSIADAIKSLRSGKVDKVSGKALSTNDYTTEEKNKLAGIAAQANKTTVDTSITSGGTNPVTGGAIYTALSGKLGTSGDSKDNTVTFTSSDTTDANAISWTSVSQLTSGISHATFFNRASQMFKNVRYLYKLLGTTDISSIGNGSVTGALSTLNTYIGWKGPSNITSLATLTAYFDNLVTTGVRTGYLSAAQSSAVGLPNNGFYWQILSQSQNYAVVLFWAIGGDKLYTLYKGNGTWASTFTLLPYRSEVDKLNTELVGVGPNWHNSIYRGKNLGTSISTAQNTAIENRTYDDMFIGDYWVINNHTWRIAAFDYYYRVGDTDFQKGNILVVPDANLYNMQMAYTESGVYEVGSANTTEGGYTNSYGFTTGLNQARTIAATDFGIHVATHRIICTNATSNGKPSGWAWRDSDGVELMNEQQVYGSNAWGAREQNGYDVGSQYIQLPLFTLDPSRITVRQTYWLQDVRSAVSFALVNFTGTASYAGASYALGCRPAVTLTYT